MQNSTGINPALKQPPRRSKNVSERQLAANRAMPQKFTGPITEEGKARSRFNSLAHGITLLHDLHARRTSRGL